MVAAERRLRWSRTPNRAVPRPGDAFERRGLGGLCRTSCWSCSGLQIDAWETRGGKRGRFTRSPMCLFSNFTERLLWGGYLRAAGEAAIQSGVWVRLRGRSRPARGAHHLRPECPAGEPRQHRAKSWEVQRMKPLGNLGRLHRGGDIRAGFLRMSRSFSRGREWEMPPVPEVPEAGSLGGCLPGRGSSEGMSVVYLVHTLILCLRCSRLLHGFGSSQSVFLASGNILRLQFPGLGQVPLWQLACIWAW